MTIAQNRLTNDNAYRMSEARVLLDATFRSPGIYAVPGRTHGSLTATGGTITDSRVPVSVILAVTGTNASRALMQTHEAFRPGRSRHALYHSDAGATNQVRRWGRFDASSGFFFQLSGTTLSIVVRSSLTAVVVDTAYPSIAWSADRADGSGSLGPLDLTLPHAYEVEVPQGNVGTARFFIDGVLVHELDCTALLLTDTSTLPSAHEIVNTGTSSVASMTVMSERVIAFDDGAPLVPFSVDVPATAAPATPGLFLCLRPRSISGPVNRGVILPRALLLSVSTGSVSVRFRKGNTASGDGYDIPPGSIGEVSFAAEDLTASSTIVGQFTVVAGAPVEIDLRRFFDRTCIHDIEADALSGARTQIQIQIVGTGAETVSGSLAWHEVQP